MTALGHLLPWIGGLSLGRKTALHDLADAVGLDDLIGVHAVFTSAQRGRFVEAAGELLNSQWGQREPVVARRLALQLRADQTS